MPRECSFCDTRTRGSWLGLEYISSSHLPIATAQHYLATENDSVFLPESSVVIFNASFVAVAIKNSPTSALQIKMFENLKLWPKRGRSRNRDKSPRQTPAPTHMPRENIGLFTLQDRETAVAE